MGKQDKILAKRKAAEPNPKLDDILNRKVLDKHLANGIVKVATHPTLPLYLYDYSTLCERRSAWDGVTTLTRGLLRDNKGTVIGRPLRKFFSYGGKSSSAVPAFRWTDDWRAIEKVDGTMIVASNYHGELVLTTRGSFDAWQIAAARKIWPQFNGEDILPTEGTTWVLEYVGPDNKIVLDYDESALYLLAAIDNWTGEDVIPIPALFSGGFKTPRVIADALTREEVMAMGKDDGTEEGYVFWSYREGKPAVRLKCKYESYKQRHLQVFGKAND